MSEFGTRLDSLRPALHRYCARLMGSVIDGEDVVQDVLIKALDAAPSLDEAALKQWMFRVAHNRALDLLRARNVRLAASLDDVMSEGHDVTDRSANDPVDDLLRHEAMRTAVSRFGELPPVQRSAVILKDVLDESLAEIADLLGLSIDSVKAHLARGRARLRAINAEPRPAPFRAASDEVARFVDLFNQRDWQALRALLAGDVRLKQSDYPLRTEEADLFFTFYARTPPRRVAAAWLDGREVIAVYDASATTASHFMWLEWRDRQISFIRDYRYVSYIVTDTNLTD